VSDELVSAADLANKPVSLLMMTLLGLTGGGIALSSQYWGKGEVAPIRRIAAMILQTGVLISFLAATAILLFPQGTMRIFTADPVVIEKGAEYLGIAGWSFYIVGITIVFAAMLRSVEIVRVALYADITALVISVSLNWVLIFGNLGFPALGIRGAAISTLTARIASLLIISTFVFVLDKRLKFRPKHVFGFDRRLFGDIIKYGFPVLLGQMTWALGITVQAMIIGRVDYTAGDFVAANAANNVIYQLFIVAV
jgi:Na+-driven multidrug efflux pump